MRFVLVSIKFILKFTVFQISVNINFNKTEYFYRAFQYLRPKLDVTKVKN